MSNEVAPHHRTPKTVKNYFTVDTAKMGKVFFKHFMDVILLFAIYYALKLILNMFQAFYYCYLILKPKTNILYPKIIKLFIKILIKLIVVPQSCGTLIF